MKRTVLAVWMLVTVCILLIGCGNGNNGGNDMLSPIFFENIPVCDDIDRFIAEVDHADGSHNNEAHDVGVIISPYFRVRLHDVEIPCYAVRTGIGAHSFVMLDAASEAFPASLTVLCETDGKDVTVLPTTHGITL